MKKKYLSYDDIALVPQYSTVDTRKSCNTTAQLASNSKFRLPVIPANMQCVIDTNIASFLSENNYFYIMHRFNIDIYNFVHKANTEKWKTVSISTGINYDTLDTLMKINKDNLRVDYITIDIAHGHHEKVKQRILACKQLFPKAFIIAGNVCTLQAFNDLSDWGADAVKVGIGQGSACTTKLKTGFTMPMFTCVLDIAQQTDRDTILIADGGIKHNGDIAKAIVAGADWVMAGGIFASCSDSPASIDNNGKKIYYGSASAENKGYRCNVEGTTVKLDTATLSYSDKLQEIKEDLQSAISYAGGLRLRDLLLKDIWVNV